MKACYKVLFTFIFLLAPIFAFLFLFPRKVAACTTDYSQIDGNLVQNPYLECDNDEDTIPDGWAKSSSDGIDRILTWEEGPGSYEDGKVLVSEFSGNITPNGFGWTSDTISLSPNTWYELSITYKVEGLEPTLDGDDDSIVSNSEWIGVLVEKTSTGGESINWPNASISSRGIELTDWDPTVAVFRTYTPANHDWTTSTRYFKSSPIISTAYIRTLNYPKGKLYVDNVALKPVDGNYNPDQPSFQKSGTLDFIQYKSQNFFPIILYGLPTEGGIPIGLDQVTTAGFNSVSERYTGYDIDERKQLFIDNDLAVMVSLYDPVWAPGTGTLWVNDPLHANDYQGLSRSTAAVDDWTGYSNLLMFGHIEEIECHPSSKGTFIPNLDTYETVTAYVRSNSPGTPILVDNCDWPYTGITQDTLDYYFPLGDAVSFTTNTPNAYVQTSGTYTGSPKLPHYSDRVRWARVKSSEAGDAKIPIAFGLGVYSWSKWDGSSSTTNTYIPFNLQRFQIFDQIINGATGVWFYGTSNINLDDDYYNHHFEQIKALSTELNSLLPVLRQSVFYDGWEVSDTRVDAMMKKYNGKLYLLTASTHYEDLHNVTFTLDDEYVITSVTALDDVSNGDFTNATDRSITNFTAHSFTDNYIGENGSSPQGEDAPGYAVHVYEIEYDNLTDVEPQNFSLRTPLDFEFTNVERPTFSWQAHPQADTRVSAYNVQLTGKYYNFSMKNIPVSRITPYEPDNFFVSYENFTDSDNSNNYLMAHTEPSSLWTLQENDGKLREGSYVWEVKSTNHTLGLENIQRRTIIFDETEPTINLTNPRSNGYTFSYQSSFEGITFTGTVRDNLSGYYGDDKVASGPNKLKITIKKDGSTNEVLTDEIEFENIYWVGSGDEVLINSKNLDDKYTTFSYELRLSLLPATYKVYLTARDNAGNDSETLIIPLVIGYQSEESHNSNQTQNTRQSPNSNQPQEIVQPQETNQASSFPAKPFNFSGKMLIVVTLLLLLFLLLVILVRRYLHDRQDA